MCLRALPHAQPRLPASSSPFLFGGDDQRSVAIFYGSGSEFSDSYVPDELRWRVEALGALVESGHVRVLDVVVAIKSAMPPDWLSEHGMDADCTSIVFMMSHREIIDIYVAALRAWGAENTIQPVIDDSVLSSGSIAIESIAATGFDVPKTLGQPNGRGFRFTKNDLQVTFPNGPISLFTQAVVGPRSPVNFAHFSFKYLGGNDAWSVGVIPENQSQSPTVLWGARGIVGRMKGGGSFGSSLPPFQCNSSDTLTSCIDAVQAIWFLCVNGKIVAREPIPLHYFPVTHGICGHNGSSFESMPNSEVPPEVVGQCKLALSVSSAVIWQVSRVKIHRVAFCVRVFVREIQPHLQCSGYTTTVAGCLTTPSILLLWKKHIAGSLPRLISLPEHLLS